MDNQINSVWIFHGAQGRFAGAVFTSVEKAEQWIKKHNLAGVLTEYPLDEGVYDWAIENELFAVKKDSQKESVYSKFHNSGSRTFSL
jgi:hypothetical protein